MKSIKNPPLQEISPTLDLLGRMRGLNVKNSKHIRKIIEIYLISLN